MVENQRQALKVLQNVYNTKTALNFGALFADGTDSYRHPAELKIGDSVTLRFRTGRNNVDAVYLVYNGERCNMQVESSDELFDYYAYTISEVTDDIDYYYMVLAGNVICYYNKLGTQKDLNPDYNFQIAPGFSVPKWARGAVFYQIFVDRFYNGDPSNDVEDNEYCYIGEGTRKVKDWFKYPDNMDVRSFYGGDLQGVMDKLDYLQDLGVEVKTNMVIGRVLSVDELFEMGYKAIFIGSGAGLPSFMGIEGEDLIGVYSANEYLTRTNLMKAYLEDYDTPIIKSKSVAVVGGGNVAMDAARCAKRLGAENVYIVYRRGMEEMPARKEEVHHAMEEGIIFKNLNNPVKILGDENGRVRAMECIEMELGEPDASGRRKPIAKEGSNFELPVDTVIMSIGTSPNPLIRSTTPGLDTIKRGCLVVNEDTMQTTREGVYAGGDAVTGAATVILAMGAGKQAAQSIDEYLSKN